MSAIVSGIVNSTLGLLCNKLRDYTAQRLNEGDISDSQCRQMVVREIDDIKQKLDGLSRKDLLASLSFFKEAVTDLYISLTTCGESCEKPSTSQAHTEDDEREGATATMAVEQFPVKQVEGDAIDTAFDLHKLIGNLKIASEERYQSAKKSFEEAKRLATEAFNNTALSTEDRVMASKLRIASRILGCLDDQEAAVHGCLLYLKELHDLPAIQAMFTVWQEKGFTSRLRARFNQTKRKVMVESIQAINEFLLNLTLQYTKMKMGVLNWPIINISKGIYYPILGNKEIMKKLEQRRYREQVPWISQHHGQTIYGNCAVTSTGKILSETLSQNNQPDLKITETNGECLIFCTIPSDKDGDILNEICCFAVDENDNVYIVIENPSRYENVSTQYKLLTFDENGNAIADRALDIIEMLRFPQMTVTKDGKLVIYCHRIKSIYICDSTNAEEDYKILLPLKNVHSGYVGMPRFTVSDQNEIISAFRKIGSDGPFVVQIITIDGKLKCEVQVPTTIHSTKLANLDVAFDYVNKTILVSVFSNALYKVEKTDKFSVTSLFIFSMAGEVLQELTIRGLSPHKLTSHPNGPVTMVSNYTATILQM